MMTLDFMQKVDYWLGRPLCLFASIIEKIFPSWIANAADGSSTTEKAIFIELSEMGAAIVAAPAIRRAIESFGRENLYFLIFNRNKTSVQIQNLFEPQNIL